MTHIASFAVVDRIGLITVDSPPVNALGIAVRRAIAEGIRRFSLDSEVNAIIILCAGRTFFAGADINEFNQPVELPNLRDIIALIESVSKPTIAALHGTALGGGLEVALGCNYRIAVPSAKMGFPEVQLGLLPGAGGTQRLPRIVGVEMALDMMITGKTVSAAQALSMGIIDALVEEDELRRDAIAFAQRILAEGGATPNMRNRQPPINEARSSAEIFEDVRNRNARASRGFKAPNAIVDAVEVAITLPFDDGISREAELFDDLLASVESAAQRYYFFAERDTTRVPDIAGDVHALPIQSVGVIGAGTMGGGIAMNFVGIGIPVVLVETDQPALDRAVSVIRRNYEASAAKGRMTTSQVEQRMSLLTPVIGLEALSNVDLIIEAVFESMPVKREVFGKLDAIAKPGAILASNTSFLDLNEIAASTNRAEWLIGLHFFSPANVMRLVEVVRRPDASKQVIATVMKLARQIGKTPVLCGVCNGFIANRAMAARASQADSLILEGTKIEDVDRALFHYGFAMGHFQMMDMVGLDVLGRDSDEITVMGELVAHGRLGQKKNGGYYDYDEKRKASSSSIAAELIAKIAQKKGVSQRPTAGYQELVARLLYPVVNEGAKILQEKIAIRASDIDVALITGYNWPVYTGGPMFWADMVGLPKIVAKLKDYQVIYGDVFKPAALLEKLAAEGRCFKDLASSTGGR